nr:aldo/keto reductase [Arcanobacterium buesumense]
MIDVQKMLHSGFGIPLLGFGTYKVDPAETAHVVQQAFAVGYRHIDTAQMYGNEDGVGQALVESGLPRQHVFITTKLDNPNHEPDRIVSSFGESLRKLRTDYVDLFLMHWPLPMHYEGRFAQTFAAMEELVGSGQVRSVGVSNFQVSHLEQLVDAGTGVPVINQIEIHPYFQNREVVAYCQAAGIVVEAWSPLGRGKDLADPVIRQIAAKHAATPAQVVLAWHRAEGFVAIPKASSLARQRENFDSLNVVLDAGDVDAIRGLDRGESGRMGPHPDVFAKM